MSLHLVESTQQEQLAEALVQQVAASAGAQDCLQATTVIVQNAGLGRWLRLWHARDCGISAAVKMPFAQSYIAKVLEREGCYDRWLELSPQVMRWQIFALLQRRAFETWTEAGALIEYLSPEHGNVERRCWSLAGRLANLFERYAVHRPEWIEAWLSGASVESALPHWHWQAQLFRAIIEAIGWSPNQVTARLFGRALQSYLTGEASSNDTDLAPVYVFGISSFPPAFLRFFERFARSREVYLYHLVPSETYLGDLPKNYRAGLLAEAEIEESGLQGADLFENPLLVANGQSAARFQSLLLSLDFPVGEMPLPVARTSASDLLRLQDTLRFNQAQCEFAADGSISMHRCHKRTREVQVLQQQLLALFAADPTLRPNDIMVLVPEIADYTDAIQSVFEMGTRTVPGSNPVKIPFCIADQKSSEDENCRRFLNALLDLLQGRQLFSEVAALLDFDPVCECLDLDRDVLKELLNKLQAVGVRWGIDGPNRVASGLPDDAAHTWEYGIQRLYDGFIYGDEVSYDDMAPYAVDSRMMEAVGSLTRFLSPIFQLVASRSQPRRFSDWSEALLKVVSEMLGSEAKVGGDWIRLLSVSVGSLKDSSTDTKIGFDTFCLMLAEAGSSESGPSGLLRRGVTFCRLQPARHIPARVVCLLGLDEGSYPRREKQIEFDLIHLQRRYADNMRGTKLAYLESHYLGDSHMRDEDRQLFLDCLLNARERLYLSYVGQSDLSNEALPPSLLVSELRQFLERVPRGDTDALQTRFKQVQRIILSHPLQEWSRENYKSPLPSRGEAPVPVHFNMQFGNIEFSTDPVAPFLQTMAAPASTEADPMHLTGVQLLRFLKDPAKVYLTRQLQVKLDALDWMDTFEDQEHLQLDGLERWNLRKRVLDAWLLAKQQGHLGAEFVAELQRRWELDLTLPAGHAGDVVWSSVVCPILEVLEFHLSDVELRKSHSRVVMDAVTYSDEYWEDAAGQRVLFIAGSLDQTKYLLEAFIHHIGSERGSLILNLKENSCTQWPAFKRVESDWDEGRAWLANILPLWRLGHTTALPFSLEIAKSYLGLVGNDPSADWEAALTIAHRNKWTTHNGYGQDHSEAQCLCFDGLSPASVDASVNLRQDFTRNAVSILGPVLEWRQQMNSQKGGN